MEKKISTIVFLKDTVRKEAQAMLDSAGMLSSQQEESGDPKVEGGQLGCILHTRCSRVPFLAKMTECQKAWVRTLTLHKLTADWLLLTKRPNIHVFIATPSNWYSRGGGERK